MRIIESSLWLFSLVLFVFIGSVWSIQQGRFSSQMVMSEEAEEVELIQENGSRAKNKLETFASFFGNNNRNKNTDDDEEDLIRPFQSHFNQQEIPEISNEIRNDTQESNSTLTTENPVEPESPHKQTVIALKGSQNELITNEDGEVYLIRVDPITKETSMMNMSKIKDIDFQNAKLTLDTSLNAKPPLEKYSIAKYEPFQWYRVLSEGVQPNQRGGHSMTIVGQTIVLFGGCHLDMECYNDFIFYDIMSKEWTNPKTIGEPPSVRGGHSATLVGQYIYIYGGSSDRGVLSDIHRFNLESRLWEQFEYEGEKPPGRSNHKAILDNSGRIVIFGGYTNKGYSNEVYFLDLVNMRWVKPMVNGEPPLGRENFSMNLVRESYIWIFGGYALGGETNDLWQLDVDMLKWTRIFASYGKKPIERQGHQMILHGKLLFAVGGCNYKQQKCFNDLYQLHTDDLTWTKLDFPIENELKARDNFGMSLMGSNLYLFGGCEMMQKCYNDFQVMNITDICPRNCSGRGTCRNNRCSCDQGYQGEECETRLMCESNCLNRGFCGSDARCHCYPGYSGNLCQIYVPCPSNCTSIASGRCEASGKCICTEGNSGDACEIGSEGLIPLKTVCPNDCSHHGVCNVETGICICEEGYGDLDCSLTEEIKKEKAAQAQKLIEEAEKAKKEAELALATNNNSTSVIDASQQALNSTELATELPKLDANQTQAQQDLLNSSQESVTSATEVKVEAIIDGTEQPEETTGNQSDSTDVSSQPKESDSTPIEGEGVISDKITEFIHSQMLRSQMMAGKQEDDRSSQIEEVTNCENSCSFSGVCIDGECFCKPGVTGRDCSVVKISQLSEGQKLIKFLFFGPLFFIIGIALGFLYIKQLKVKQELQEFGEITAYGKKEQQEKDIHEANNKAKKGKEIQNKAVEDGSEEDSFSQDLIEQIDEQNQSKESLENQDDHHPNQKHINSSMNHTASYNKQHVSKEITIQNDE